MFEHLEPISEHLEPVSASLVFLFAILSIISLFMLWAFKKTRKEKITVIITSIVSVILTVVCIVVCFYAQATAAENLAKMDRNIEVKYGAAGIDKIRYVDEVAEGRNYVLTFDDDSVGEYLFTFNEETWEPTAVKTGMQVPDLEALANTGKN